MADALSRKPCTNVVSKKLQVSAVSIAYYNKLDAMKEQYATDDAFSQIYDQLTEGKRHEPYTLKEGFLWQVVCDGAIEA